MIVPIILFLVSQLLHINTNMCYLALISIYTYYIDNNIILIAHTYHKLYLVLAASSMT